MKRSVLILRYVFMALSAFLMIAIFCFSSQDGDTSGGLSDDIAEALQTVFDSLKMPNVADFMATYVRKCAHAAIYAALGASVCVCVFTFDFKRKWLWIVLPVLICFLYACGDEFHQLFVEDRDGKFTDVLIDGAGFMFSVIVANIINFCVYRARKKAASEKENITENI